MMLCEGAMGYECSLLRQSAAHHQPFASRERAGRCGYVSWCPEGSCEAEPSTASAGAAASERPSREASAAGPQSEAAPAAPEPAAGLSEQAAAEDSQRSGEAGGGDAEEPLLASNDNRFTMYPVRCAGPASSVKSLQMSKILPLLSANKTRTAFAAIPISRHSAACHKGVPANVAFLALWHGCYELGF